MRRVKATRADVVIAAAVGATLSGLPSTVYAIAKGRPILEATEAAGSILLPEEASTARLVVSAAVVHTGLSTFWAGVIAGVLPERAPRTFGALLGLTIGVLDLVVVGRRWPRIRALPSLPQLADHVAFGALVGHVLARRTAGARSAPGD